ncbi:NAD(P)-dependent oxidoreductase [Microbulbifer sp. ALW1]|uniref:NAD-dependent epimerase/dehydratase family protein n=1 Tax=Microbulbifer sp. (strain ALW1) TaxID=1516059 RepID=UPI001358D2DA|nr:NAD(P)-dependent oxidoreductase [Microbulbifer sp. ALW1]
MGKVAVIFGGSGFIGSHFSAYLLKNNLVDSVVIADLVEPRFDKFGNVASQVLTKSNVHYQFCDVREKITISTGSVVLVANFAAIHREPGHQSIEYFETNIKGAENVCEWVSSVRCEKLIFTSSIAPYGPTEEEKFENSVPVPISAYGASKLVAEKIHLAWQAEDKSARKLVIVRPGVVYGPGEGGNVTRLVRAVLKGYFFYMGNRNTRKAGTYVKELCNAMWWVLENRTDEGVALFNMSMNPGPTIEQYVNVVCDTAKVTKFTPSLPYWFLYPCSVCLDILSKPFGIQNSISPVRLRKLVKSNNIIPKFLDNKNYSYMYSFQESMADWKYDCESDWQ